MSTLKEEKEFQRTQLATLIQRVGEELDSAIDMQLSSNCVVDSNEYMILQEKINNLSDRYDKLSRLYVERYEKPWWKDRDNLLTRALGVVAGTAILYGGEYALTKQKIKWQNSGEIINDRVSTNNWTKVLKELF